MDEVRNDLPSLPPNYTSLVQLRERWELEQKQKNNPEWQRHQERERAERDPEQRERGQRGQNFPNQTRPRDIATSHPQNQRYQHHPKPDISQFEAAVLDDVAQKQQQQLKKRWKKKEKKNSTMSKSNWDEQKANNNERNAEREGTGATAVVEPEETAVVEGNESDNLREIDGFRRNFRVNGVYQGGNRRVEKEKKYSSEVKASSTVQDILAVSVNGGKEGNVRSWEGRNRRYSNGRRDGNYVWVKKGEGTDAGVNGVQRSGTFNMDRTRWKHSRELEAKRED